MTHLTGRPPLSLAFIGGGINSAVGQTHFGASQLDGHWRLAAGAFSRNSEINAKTARCWNVPCERTYDSWKDMIDAEKHRIDAVSVLVPTPDHADILFELQESRIPVICEKAMVSTLEDGIKVQELCKGRGNFLAVTYNYSGYPMVRELKARIARGELGAIKQMHLEMPQEGFVRPPAIAGVSASPQSWRLKDQYIPTICLDLGVHLHHLASFLTGHEPSALSAEFSRYSTYPGIVDDVHMWMRYENGMRSSYWITKTAIGSRNGLKLRVLGDKASAEWYQLESEQLNISYLNGSHSIIDRGGQAIVASQSRYNRMKVGHPSGFLEAFANLYGDIADGVWNWKETKKATSDYVFGAETAVNGLRIFHKARESFEASSWINLND